MTMELSGNKVNQFSVQKIMLEKTKIRFKIVPVLCAKIIGNA